MALCSSIFWKLCKYALKDSQVKLRKKKYKNVVLLREGIQRKRRLANPKPFLSQVLIPFCAAIGFAQSICHEVAEFRNNLKTLKIFSHSLLKTRCVILDLLCYVNKIYPLLECYKAQIGTQLPSFRDKLSVLESIDKLSRNDGNSLPIYPA